MRNARTIMYSLIILVLLGAGFYFVFKESEKKQEKNPAGLQKVTVQAGWLLNGEFANVCSAIVNGYYRDEGLDVTLLPGGPAGAGFIVATNAIAQDKNIDIALDGDLIPLLRGRTKESPAEQLKVKAFAAFWNDNPYGFIVRADSGITSLKDFAKRKPDGSKYKIGVTADSVIQYAIANYANVDVKDLDLVITGFDSTPFLAGQVDALAGYWTTQAYEVEKAGISYRFLSASEIPGYYQPSQIALATEKTLAEKPIVLTRWLKATIKGNQFNLANPEESAKQINDNRCGGPNFDPVQELWLIKKSLRLFSEGQIGAIDGEKISKFAEVYYDLKQIPRVPSLDELIDYSILNQIYK